MSKTHKMETVAAVLALLSAIKAVRPKAAAEVDRIARLLTPRRR